MPCSVYNYEHFKAGNYNFETFEGPTAGDTYKDAELHTLDGKKVRLSEFLKDKPLVLETGSLTCPMYGACVKPMQKMAAKYNELEFVVLYVREAHPGERTPAHHTLHDKIAAARKCCQRYGDRRTTLVDSIDGTAHRFYGAMPNSIYVIDTDGTVLFRSIWNNIDAVEEVLAAIANHKKVTTKDFKPSPPFSFTAVRTLLTGGLAALWDFAFSLPRLIRMHKQEGNM